MLIVRSIIQYVIRINAIIKCACGMLQGQLKQKIKS